jgi:hypothetical protein
VTGSKPGLRKAGLDDWRLSGVQKMTLVVFLFVLAFLLLVGFVFLCLVLAGFVLLFLGFCFFPLLFRFQHSRSEAHA